MGEEPVDQVMVLVLFIVQMVEKHIIFEIEIGNSSLCSIRTLSIIHSVRIFAHRELLELHLIASESASLIRKYVIDLTQLFVQVTCLHFSGKFLGRVVDLSVPLDELGLEKLNHFHGDYQ